MRKRLALVLGGLAALLLLALLVAPNAGSVEFSWTKALDESIPAVENNDASILFDFRIPRVLFGAIVGAALAASGVVLQSLMRNYLATPFTMGISSGASLGAVLSLQLGIHLSYLGFSSVSIFAALGALGTMLLIYHLGRTRGHLDMLTLLLAGVTVNFFTSAIVLFLHYVSDPSKSFQITRWLMGSLDSPPSQSGLGALAAIVLVSLLPMMYFARDLNLLSVGEEEAQTLGVDIGRARAWLFAATSLATGAAVSTAGPIGFVGLMVPHALRLAFGPNNVLLVPASILGGAAFLVLCDALARSLLHGAEVPVGVITAFLGCPFFIWLLRRRRGEIVL